MSLKYLLVPLVAFAFGVLSPVALAKNHGKSHTEHKHKSLQKHKKHVRKHAEEPPVKPDKKQDCVGKNCVKLHSKSIIAPLPQLPKNAEHLPALPKVSSSAARLPAKPVNDLIDQTANQAKEKAREKGQ